MNFDALAGMSRSLLIYYNPLRRRQMRRFYSEFVEPGDLVFDVGAHVGSKTRALRACGAKVVAFEPQPLFARFLRRTLPHDVTLIEAALGRSEGNAEMLVSSRHPTVSSLRGTLTSEAVDMPGFEHVRWDSRTGVRMTSLDAMIEQHGMPRFIKVDVEGFEIDVLAGLTRPVELMSFEYLPGLPVVIQTVIDMINALGDYEFNVTRGETNQFVWDQWQNSTVARNWLASLAADAKSGDLYARLRKKPRNHVE